MSEMQEATVSGTTPPKRTVQTWVCYDCFKTLGQNGLTSRTALRCKKKVQVCQHCLLKNGKVAEGRPGELSGGDAGNVIS